LTKSGYADTALAPPYIMFNTPESILIPKNLFFSSHVGNVPQTACLQQIFDLVRSALRALGIPLICLSANYAILSVHFLFCDGHYAKP